MAPSLSPTGFWCNAPPKRVSSAPDKNQGDEDRRDGLVLHCIPSIIPAGGQVLEDTLRNRPELRALVRRLTETRQRLGQARDAAPRPCRSCRRCRRLLTPATAPASSPAVLPPPCSRPEGPRECQSPCRRHHAAKWSLQAPRCCPRFSDGLTLPTSSKSAPSERIPASWSAQGLPIPNGSPP